MQPVVAAIWAVVAPAESPPATLAYHVALHLPMAEAVPTTVAAVPTVVAAPVAAAVPIAAAAPAAVARAEAVPTVAVAAVDRQAVAAMADRRAAEDVVAKRQGFNYTTVRFI